MSTSEWIATLWIATMVIHMDRHTTTTMVGARLRHATADALKKIATERGTTVNAMLKSMIERRVEEIREEEGW